MKKTTFRPGVEGLGHRRVPATMAIAGDNLSFTAGAGEANNVTLSHSGGTYTFHDAGAPISAPTDPGWSGGGTNTVSVSDALFSGGIDIDLRASTAFEHVNVQSIVSPLTIETGQFNNQINVCSNAPTNTGSLAGIQAPITVNNLGGGANQVYLVNFSAAAGDADVRVGADTVTGFGPPAFAFTYNAVDGPLHLLRLIGSNNARLAEHFTVNGPNAGIFQIDGNSGGDTIVLEASLPGTTLNLNTAGFGASTFILSSDGTSSGDTDAILGVTNINAGIGPGKSLLVYDGGGAGGRDVTVTDTAVAGLTASPINYKAVGGTFGTLALEAPAAGGNTLDDETVNNHWSFSGF